MLCCLVGISAQAQQMQIPKKESIQSLITFFVNAPQQSLPFGTSKLLYDFPKRWTLPPMHKNKGNAGTDSFNIQFNFCDSVSYANRNMPNYSVMLTKFENAKAFVDPQFEVPKNWQKKSTKWKISQIILDADVKTYLVTYEGNVDCRNCEYPIRQYGRTLVSVDAQNQIIDKLSLDAERMSDLGGWKRLCFIGNDKIIHLKEFTSNELEIGAERCEQYTMLKNGHFVRYYLSPNATISNDYEQGVVSNHKRVGEWIDKKPCFLWITKKLADNWVYAVSQYKEGLLDGQAHYYKLEQDYDANGLAMLYSARKGRHLFDEYYKEGELWKREYVVMKWL